MPKIARAPEEVHAVKETILREALDLLARDGFENLSMRRLASRTGMTAANLYNYFSGKDELYLAIQTRGFEMLHRSFVDICGAASDPAERLRRFVRAYFDFGTGNPDYYDIMFSRPTPKYADYRGTELEAAATVEKETAMRVAILTVEVMEQALKDHPEISIGNPFRKMLSVWCSLHGAVSLFNSRVYQEVDENFRDSIDEMLRELIPGTE